MGVFIQILVIMAAAGLQVAFFGPVRPLGVVPNLLLLVSVLAALWLPASRALLLAVAGGLVLDFASGADFGLRTAFYAMTALVVIAFRQLGLHADSIVSAVALVLAGTILFDLAIVFNSGAPAISWSGVFLVIFKESVVNIVILMGVIGLRVLLRNRRVQISSELRRRSWL